MSTAKPSQLRSEQIEAAGIKGGRGYPHAFLTEPRPEVVEKVRLWILENCLFTKRVRRTSRGLPCSSYGWKHVAEKGLGLYVANGEFIVAAIQAGATALPRGAVAINAVFNLRLKKQPKKRTWRR